MQLRQMCQCFYTANQLHSYLLQPQIFPAILSFSVDKNLYWITEILSRAIPEISWNYPETRKCYGKVEAWEANDEKNIKIIEFKVVGESLE